MLSLALALTATAPAWSQSSQATDFQLGFYSAPVENKPAAKHEAVCTVYALKDMADDPNFGKWIVETIPQVIQPGTWNREASGTSDKRATLSYFAQGKVLVVYHTPAVQAEVSAFLENLKKAMPAEKDKPAVTQGQKVMQASWNSPAPGRAPEVMAVPQGTSYPVPPPLQQPKHLFHLILKAEGLDDLGTAVIKELPGKVSEAEDNKDKDKDKAESAKTPALHPSVMFILRYEGEGIIDNTVADVLKEIYGAKMAPKKNEGEGYTPNQSRGTSSCLPATLGAAVGQSFGVQMTSGSTSMNTTSAGSAASGATTGSPAPSRSSDPVPSAGPSPYEGTRSPAPLLPGLTPVRPTPEPAPAPAPPPSR
jgi:hypothetical protein